MTTQSPSSFSVPSSPEGGFELPSPTLTPGPSSPHTMSMQGMLIPEVTAGVSTLTHSVSVTEGGSVTSSTSSCAYPNQVWIRDFSHHNTTTSPPPLQASRSQGLQTVFTSCYRLGPPPHSTIFSLAAHRPPMPQFYHPGPRDYRQQVMAEMNYIGMPGRRVEGLPPGVIPGMHQVRMQGQSTIQYPPVFPPPLPMPQHGYCNPSPSPLYETHMPNYGHSGPQFSHFQLRPQVPPLYRPQSASFHPPQLFPQRMSQFCQQTPTSSQFYPQLHSLTTATSLSSQLRPLTPVSQLHPQASMSQFHPLSPVPQLRPLTPTSQFHTLSQIHSQTSQRASPQVSFMNLSHDIHSTFRPQTTPPKVVTPQRLELPQPVPHCQPSLIDLTNDIYATQQRTITCVRNYPTIPSSGLSSNPHTPAQESQQQSTQTIPHQQVESSQACSEPAAAQQLCISVPIQTSPRGTHHVIHRPKPIRGTTCGIPGFSPGLQAIMPSSPFSPSLRSLVVPISTSSVPVVTADLPAAVSTKPTTPCAAPGSPSPDAKEVAAITSSAGSQPKKATETKKAGKRKPRSKKPTEKKPPAEKKLAEKKPAEKKPAEKKLAEKKPAEKKPAEKKPRKPRTRRAKVPTKEPSKSSEGSCSTTVVTKDPTTDSTTEREVEIGEQVVEVVASDLTEMQIYVDFVKRFKSHHLKLGYSLEDIVQQVKIRYGKTIDLQCLKEFEDLLLQKESYVPLLEVLDAWLKDTAKASGSNDQEVVMLPANSICPHRSWKQKRKQKTLVDANVTLRLEEEFARKRSPTQSELVKLASLLGVEKDYVRNWFYNRRKKEKCMGKRPAGKEEDDSIKSKPENMETEAIGVKIPSIMYDITVEIPSIHPRDSTAPPCAEYTL